MMPVRARRSTGWQHGRPLRLHGHGGRRSADTGPRDRGAEARDRAAPAAAKEAGQTAPVMPPTQNRLVTIVPSSEIADWSSTDCVARLTVRSVSCASV